MSANENTPTTSKRLMMGSAMGSTSKVKEVRQRIEKDGLVTIITPRGKRTVPVSKGDVIVTVTARDGQGGYYTRLSVIHANPPDTQESTLPKPSVRKLNNSKQKIEQRTKQKINNQQSVLNNNKVRPKISRRALLPRMPVATAKLPVYISDPGMTPYDFWYNQYQNSLYHNNLGLSNEDLLFVNDYIRNWENIKEYYGADGTWLADPNDVEANRRYDEFDKRERLLNIALAKKPNKNLLYKIIWGHLSPYHTPERSAEDHKYITTVNAGTPNEMGYMNWQAATGKEGPDFSVEDFTPEYLRWTAGFDNPELRVNASSDNQLSIDDLILKYPDRFKNQYEYAKSHNGAFDYSPNSFDVSDIVETPKYYGIGDIMDTFGLSPQHLFEKLDKYYTLKYYNGGLIKRFTFPTVIYK